MGARIDKNGLLRRFFSYSILKGKFSEDKENLLDNRNKILMLLGDKMFKKIKTWARKLKRQIFILYFACKDERVPWYAKLFTACVVAYAFSPIDLIPDFIPILGYLDDVILVPLGIIIALKMIQRV